MRALGGAGTGKTVVAMHRARWLAQNEAWGENDRILFTTFTRNLAADIRENLTKICPEEALAHISRHIRKIETEGISLNGVCLVARTNGLLKQYESALSEKGLTTYSIRRSEAEDRRSPGLRLATMHRVKGLEFDRVIIAGVNERIVPYEGEGTDSADPVVQRETEVRERALLYVAATRAKKEVIVTSFGKASRFIYNLQPLFQ